MLSVASVIGGILAASAVSPGVAAQAGKGESVRELLESSDRFLPVMKFPESPQFVVRGQFEERPTPATAELFSIDGQPRHLLEVGTITSKLLGKAFVLRAFVSPAEPNAMSLVVPFLDGTSGRETSALGRYLSVSRDGKSKSVSLDFNQSFHPLCLYTPSLTCPLPPPENRLAVEVRAGERLRPLTQQRTAYR